MLTTTRGLVAYWSNWAQYRGLDPSTPACKDKIFLPENINPHLYTHVCDYSVLPSLSSTR